MSQTAIIVPARLASTRFPRKLLHEIRGKPLIRWVAERLARQAPEAPLFFAVDDVELERAVTAAGFHALLTSPNHTSGTDRLAEANRRIGAKFVINVQADEPLVTGAQIAALSQLIQREGVAMATLGTPFAHAEDFRNPNQVKVVTSRTGEALYFSRAPIPFARDIGGNVTPEWLAQNQICRHLGLYAYRAEFLEAFTQLPAGKLEQIEKLEQLRALENGWRIAVGVTHEPTIGIDAPEDVAAFERWLDESQKS